MTSKLENVKTWIVLLVCFAASSCSSNNDKLTEQSVEEMFIHVADLIEQGDLEKAIEYYHPDFEYVWPTEDGSETRGGRLSFFKFLSETSGSDVDVDLAFEIKWLEIIDGDKEAILVAEHTNTKKAPGVLHKGWSLQEHTIVLSEKGPVFLQHKVLDSKLLSDSRTGDDVGNVNETGLPAENSVRIVRTDPPLTETLKVGSAIKLQFEVEYTLASEESGSLAMVIQTASNHVTANEFYVVEKGHGKQIMEAVIVVPDTRALQVFTPLSPQSQSMTSTVDSRVYRVE